LKAENTIVNRPFSAFATLMMLLALAMFAVSSTGRSTAVKPPGRVQGSGHYRDGRVRGVQRRALEVSDQKSEVGGQRSDVGRKRFAVKSRDRLFVAATAGAPLKPLATRNKDK